MTVVWPRRSETGSEREGDKLVILLTRQGGLSQWVFNDMEVTKARADAN
jgi:hypothetical protein